MLIRAITVGPPRLATSISAYIAAACRVGRVVQMMVEVKGMRASNRREPLLLITQQFSLRVPNLQAVLVDYVMI
jgi:hypothetical protein